MDLNQTKRALFISALTADSGSGIRFWNMARLAADAGWAVTFLERKAPTLPGRSHSGITYCHVPERGALTLSIVRSLWRGARLAMSRRWDIVYVLKPLPNSAWPALIARWRGARILLDVDDLDYDYYPPGLLRCVIRWHFRFLPRRFHAVSYHVNPLRDWLIEEGKVSAERLHCLPQGVDLDVLDAASSLPAAIAEFTCHFQTIAYMASLGITSDLADVLPLLGRILTGHPGWGVLVLGHGVRLEQFAAQVRSMGLAERVFFAGYLPHETVPAVLRACRVGFHYLRPGGANRYRAIMKIREYLALGLPVVANPSGDVADFAEYIQITSNDEAYIAALEKAMTGAETERTQRGHRFIEEELDWPKLAPKLLELFQSREKRVSKDF